MVNLVILDLARVRQVNFLAHRLRSHSKSYQNLSIGEKEDESGLPIGTAQVLSALETHVALLEVLYLSSHYDQLASMFSLPHVRQPSW